MTEKEVLENRINEIYQKYLKDKENIYSIVCDINLECSNEEINKQINIIKENCHDYSISFSNDFIKYFGNYESYFKIYIGTKKEDYLTVAKEILDFILKNKRRLSQSKIRLTSSNDCCVLRSSDISIIYEINEYIKNNEKLRNVSLIYNPFVPRVGNVMIVPDFSGGTYNNLIANYLRDYFEKLENDENKKINIDEFCDFVEKTDTKDLNEKSFPTSKYFLHRYILIKKLKGIKDKVILEETLFEQIKLLNSLTEIFDKKLTNDNIELEAYIYDKTKLYKEAKKFFDNKDQRLISELDCNFQRRLQHGCEIIKRNLSHQNTEKSCKYVLNLICDLEKQLSEEQIKSILEKEFNLINENNSSEEMIQIVEFFNNLRSYEHILNTPELYYKMYLEASEELPEDDFYKSLCTCLYDFYISNGEINYLKNLNEDYDEIESPLEWFKEGGLEKFLTEVSTATSLTIFKKALKNKELFYGLEKFDDNFKTSKQKK